MRVRDLMTTILIAVEPETSVIDAKKTMAEHRIRHLLVMADGELRGIVTDRDIRLALPSPATSLCRHPHRDGLPEGVRRRLRARDQGGLRPGWRSTGTLGASREACESLRASALPDACQIPP